MPPISTTVVDTNAVQLLTEWITEYAVAFHRCIKPDGRLKIPIV